MSHLDNIHSFLNAISNLPKSREIKPSRPNVIKQYVACCPAHNDKEPSLAVALAKSNKGYDTLLVHCHAECSRHDVFDSLGFTASDFLPNATEFKDYKPDLTHEKLLVEVYKDQRKRGEKINPLDIPVIERAIKKIKRYENNG